jgi:hypothetical protein
MASFEITDLEGTTSIYGIMPIVNANFAVVQTAIGALEEIVDPDTQAATVSEIVIERGARPTTTTLFRNEASGSFTGSLTIGETLTAKNVTATQGLTVPTGNITLADSTKSFTNAGTTKLYGAIELYNLSNAYVEAGNPLSYDSGSVSGTTATLAVAGLHGILLDFSTYDAGDNNVLKVQLPTVTTPQVLDIIVKLGDTTASSGAHCLTYNNIAGLESTQKVEFTADYQCVRLAWVGTEWIILNLHGAEVAAV